jgi:WD40 repeat protein
MTLLSLLRNDVRSSARPPLLITSLGREVATTVFALVGLFLASSRVYSQTAQLPIEIVPQLENQLSISAIAFSLDGKLLLSGSSDGSVRLRDVQSGRELRTFQGPQGSASFLDFSVDSHRIFSDHALWDAESGAVLKSGFKVKVFSPDHHRAVLLAGDFTFKLWDMDDDRLIRTFRTRLDYIRDVAFSLDGRRIASISADGGAGINAIIEVWDADSGRRIRTWTMFAHHLTFCPDGRRIVAGLYRSIKLLDVETGDVVRSFTASGSEEPGNYIYSVAVSPDCQRIASGQGSSVRVWHATNGHEVWAREHESSVKSVAFSPDGRRIVSGGDADGVKLWDSISGRELPLASSIHANFVTSLAVSPDGSRIASGNWDNTVKLWDATSGRGLRIFNWPLRERYSVLTTPYSSVAFSPDGKSIVFACTEGTLKLWDVESGRDIQLFTDSSSVMSVAFSPDGKNIASGGTKGAVSLWDVKTGLELKKFIGHRFNVWSVAFSPDGLSLVSGGGDQLIKLWSLQSGRELHTFSSVFDQITSVAFSYDGRRIVSGGDNVATWDVDSGQKLQTFGKYTNSSSAVFAPDGRTIVTGNRSGVVTIWSADDGRKLRTIYSPRVGYQPTVAEFLPDGRRIISAGLDGQMQIRDVSTGLLIGTAVSFDNDEWIFLTPEGFFDASANGAKYLNVVRGLEVYSIDQFYDTLHRPDLVQQKLAGDPQGLVKAAAAKLDLDKVATSGGTPSVSIANPSSTTVSDAQVVIEATVTDQGGGIGRVEWRNNKKTIDLDTASGAASSTSGRSITLKKTVPLVNGDNVIEIKAYNGQNLIESVPVQITVRRTEQAQAMTQRPQLYVLAVGVNDYWDSKLHLNFAVPDAKSMAAGLQRAGSNLYEHVNVTTVLDVEVSATTLDRVFADLKGKVQAQDVFVFFLSGHGKTEDGKFYYIPQNFRYNGADSIVQNAISHDRLKAWFAQIPAHKSVLLFDACESGALIQEQIAMRGLEDKTALDHLVRATGATVLTATTDDKPAAEGYRGHGVFTYTLLSAFANADANGDGFIDVQELAIYVAAQVPALTDAAWGIRQSPQFNVVGSIYPLVAKTSLLPATNDVPAAAISATPTHVVIAAAIVRQSASAGSSAVVELKPGTQVRLMETSGGWLLVAREGKKLGYIDAKAVLGLQ